jgi:hypothetical protein
MKGEGFFKGRESQWMEEEWTGTRGRERRDGREKGKIEKNEEEDSLEREKKVYQKKRKMERSPNQINSFSCLLSLPFISFSLLSRFFTLRLSRTRIPPPLLSLHSSLPLSISLSTYPPIFSSFPLH